MKIGDESLKVALLGCGTVGSNVARLLLSQAENLAQRVGRPLELVGIGDKVHSRPGIPASLFTPDLKALVTRGDVDVVIELLGGIEPARTLILAAIASGASVVTANKALLAEDGATLHAAAEKAGVDLYYEAAVAGAIPIIRPLRESLVGDEVTAVMGIVNGTTNYILDKMHTEGSSFEDALEEAQALGYAEANPTADIEGFDAAAKAAILAGLAFHSRVALADVDREGITSVTSAHIKAAKQMDCVIKLLAHCALTDDGSIAVGVHPTLLPVAHPLANISGSVNAIFLESRNAGQLMFMGPGAGGAPTASAVLGDVVTAARNRVRGVAGYGESVYLRRRIATPEQVMSKFYLSMNVLDQLGVLAKVAACFAEGGVSLQAVRQDSSGEIDSDRVAGLGVMTHVASEADISATVFRLVNLPFVRGPVTLMRVEGM